MITKRYDQVVEVDLDKLEELLYKNFYPGISHRKAKEIISSIEIGKVSPDKIEAE